MEIINRPTKAEQLERIALDPVAFATETGLDYTPRPSQQRMLRSPLDRLISITSKRRQIGATTTLAHWVAWSMLVKRSGWKAYVVAPNEFQSGNVLELVHSIYDQTPLIRDNLTGAKKNDTVFALRKKNTKTELLLVGDTGGKGRVGASIKDHNGILVYEEYNEIAKARDVTSHLNAMTAWGGGIFYCGTKAGFSGPLFDKWQFISAQVEKGNPRYRVFTFPLIEFIRERHGQGISIEWLRERKSEEPEYIWRREYLGQFAEASNSFFPEDDVKRCWQTHEAERIRRDPHRTLILGIDWGLRDATALIYAQDNEVDDRLEVVDVRTYRLPEHCKEWDTPVANYDEIVNAVVTLRDRGLDPAVVYCDKNNKGGVYSDQLANVHGFNVEDRSWSTNVNKTQALRSLANLIKSQRFLFPRDERLLFELARYAPTEDPETGKYKFRDHNDDCICAMAQMSDYMRREDQPIEVSASLGAPMLDQSEDLVGEYAGHFAFAG
jgi:hypothetical protein